MLSDPHVSAFLDGFAVPDAMTVDTSMEFRIRPAAKVKALPDTRRIHRRIGDHHSRRRQEQFLWRAQCFQTGTSAACLREFLPPLAREDVIPSLGLRRTSKMLSSASSSTACGSVHKRRCHERQAPYEAIKFDSFVAKYGGRLLGGAREEDSEAREGVDSATLLERALKFQSLPPTLLMNCFIAGITSTMVGYDIGASSAALDNLVSHGGLPMQTLDHAALSPLLQGWIVASVWVGNLMGTLGAYHVPNSRRLLLVSGVLNGVGGLSAGLAPNLSMLIAGRLLCGVGNGCVTVGLSQYLGEISPASGRGGGIAALETTFIVGAVLGAVLGRVFLKTPGGWRRIWGMSCPLGLAAFAAMLQLPDTPRAIFLRAMAAARRGDLTIEGERGGTGGLSLVEGDVERRNAAALQLARRQAQGVMLHLRNLEAPDESLIAELDEMEQFYGAAIRPAASSSSGGPREDLGEVTFRQMMGSSVHRRSLSLAALAMITPAMTGHAAVMTYGTQIFKSVGYGTADSADLTVFFHSIKLIVTLPDFVWLDAFPRRMLMNIGLMSMIGSYVLAMIALPLHLPGTAVMALVASAAAYQASVGPLSWIMPTEVLPNELRAKGSALTSTLYAGAGLTLVQLHPLLARQGPMTPLLIYTGCTSLALALNHWRLPETMGLSLEAIERETFRDESDRDDPTDARAAVE